MAVPSSPSGKNRKWWSLLFILIAILSIYAVTRQSKSFSLHEFISDILSAHPLYLGLGFLSMLGFILFEGVALRSLTSAFGYRQGFFRYIVYSASDLYFSAITPSATGGQPASAYFMMKDGIPGSISAAVLLSNICCYALSIVILGAAAFLFCPQAFAAFGPGARIMFYLGAIAQLLVIGAYLLVMKKPQWILSLGRGLLRLLLSLHILKDEDLWMGRLESSIENYKGHIRRLGGKKRALAAALFWNLMQRACQLLVPMFVYLALGGAWRSAPLVFFLQALVILGVTFIPIPGAMGATDFMMLDAYRSFLSAPEATHLELLSRSVSFYLCILLCGLIVLFQVLFRTGRRKSPKSAAVDADSVE